ncbi:hypothetical protein QJS04_geneDACA019429 [Acorus gramineus]|uniref:Transmembrane protein n=1 Tax=Acorus gramineus TaxID=55184 RepID=A0AAV9AKE3_ACOGR|nr:hypothetical protein QJS04_geneDACA019429 [Acorus gramineus]
MAIIGDALRQAFMPKREYESLREEEKVWGRLQRPLFVALAAAVTFSIAGFVYLSLAIAFPPESGRRPFCRDRRIHPLSVNVDDEPDLYRGSLYLTDEEVSEYYWLVVFVPSLIVFLASVVYLLAGMVVAYSAPRRHAFLKVVENNYCASKRGGVRCLAILNIVFAVIFGLFALFLGSSILTLGTSCSIPLFWCYEIATWGLVTLYGGTAFFLRRKAALILDEGNFGRLNLGVEMLESQQMVVTPEMERRVSEGFKAWMGSSLLSSDEEDDDRPDDYEEAPAYTIDMNSDRHNG